MSKKCPHKSIIDQRDNCSGCVMGNSDRKFRCIFEENGKCKNPKFDKAGQAIADLEKGFQMIWRSRKWK